ncbi:hypothetical protein [Lysinibacillus sp. LZ02]|uniref:hypothetical protein n=1 Tax=Lysinibacillus sp. LZ02 TaxID=3420668 RepID=UPI003D35E0D6
MSMKQRAFQLVLLGLLLGALLGIAMLFTQSLIAMIIGSFSTSFQSLLAPTPLPTIPSAHLLLDPPTLFHTVSQFSHKIGLAILTLISLVITITIITGKVLQTMHPKRRVLKIKYDLFYMYPALSTVISMLAVYQINYLLFFQI